MKDMTLAEWVAERTQVEAAKQIGCGQTGVSAMLRSGRKIYVRVDNKGNLVRVWEEREVGRRRAELKATA
ncbi:Cro/CI family transcriptional regulator [uncultured Halomonas sp.]|uniref:Cro/CI family transcriptional regulator n=1 Tax=uncultured Halomonas sp. TaxID=173971 RepID=UPI00260E5C1D|nr:Cro/CI family transcriptional regulator [uncultured Halomonas sp.]